MKNILIGIGLGLNLLGTAFLAFPILKSKMWLKDDFIIKSGKNDKGEFWYERRGIRKIKRLAVLGNVISIRFYSPACGSIFALRGYELEEDLLKLLNPNL